MWFSGPRFTGKGGEARRRQKNLLRIVWLGLHERKVRRLCISSERSVHSNQYSVLSIQLDKGSAVLTAHGDTSRVYGASEADLLGYVVPVNA